MMNLREISRQLFLSTLDELRVTKVLQRHIHYREGILRVGETDYTLNQFRRIKVVSLGKAAVPMAQALMHLVRPHLRIDQTFDGIVVGTSVMEGTWARSFLGGHPSPDEQSSLAAAAVLEYLSESDSDCLVFFLISGGASTMLEQPLDPTMTSEETAAFHQVLVHSGLCIEKMNVLRKHFSAVKGGRLAVAAANAVKCTLLISDVPASELHIIGSGPTLPDPSTVTECLAILAEQAQSLPFSERVMQFFAADTLPETPKEQDPAFLRTSSLVLLSSDDLCVEATALAQRQGFHVLVDNTCDDWSYGDAAAYLLQRIVALHKLHGKVCLLSAGEISVQVEGAHGIGGRNQHFVLECARRIAESGQRVTVLSGGTDGIDGNSQAAGGIADQTTLARAAALGLSVSAALTRFDSNALLAALGDTLITGPTGNNVRDLRILLMQEQPDPNRAD